MTCLVVAHDYSEMLKLSMCRARIRRQNIVRRLNVRRIAVIVSVPW
jgi:hypothetical protein